MVSADLQAPTPLIRIGELSRRTGVRPDAIRAWERRYRLLDPVRSPGGYRLYSEADERVVRAMRRLTGQGLAAAEAAKLAGADEVVAPAPSGGALDPAAESLRLLSALEAFDEPGAEAVLDAALAGLSLDRFLEGVVLDAMAEIGARWERGSVTVAQEHFASALVRGRLLGLARGWGAGSGPLAVLACVPGEHHDLGLISFGLCLRERGWRIAFLGADTPTETLEAIVGDLHPRWLVLAAARDEQLAAVRDRLAPLAKGARVGLGGAGAAAAGAIEGVTLLRGGPAEGADALAADLAGA
jgi:DNA-binding transcriptional MerR regulator/methanogenic corrinoid protein MtbC1